MARSLHHTTADKREIKDFPELPLATFFIRRALLSLAPPYFSYIWNNLLLP
jgi:hypothetical protein